MTTASDRDENTAKLRCPRRLIELEPELALAPVSVQTPVPAETSPCRFLPFPSGLGVGPIA